MSATTNPATLPVQSQKSNVYPRAQAVFAICALVILLLLFNFYPQNVGFWTSASDGSGYPQIFSSANFVSILSPAFFEQYLPWLNLCWILALGLNIAHLSLGRWTLATRLPDLGLAFLALNVVVAMIFGSSIFAIAPQAALDGAWTTTVQTVVSILSRLAPLVLGVIALGLVIDMIKKVVDLVRSISP